MLQLTMPRYKKIEAISKESKDCISFSQGAVRVGGTPQVIKDHVKNLLSEDCADYYQNVGGIYPLRQKIAQELSEKFRRVFTSDSILVTHGSIGGITNLCLSLLKQGDEVILPEPTYPSYQNIIRFSKGMPVFIPGFIEEKGAWRFDLSSIVKAVTKRTKMIILPNPSNPLGVCLKKDDIQALINFCQSTQIYLVLDEVYDHYIYEGEFHSGTPYVLDNKYVVRTASFSKDFAMSGWRIGYVVASPELIAGLVTIQDGTLCCPSVVGQHAALFALQNRHLIEQQVCIVKDNLKLTCAMLQPLVEKRMISYIKPQAGIFLFINTGLKDSEPLVFDILEKAKVALVPGKDFGTAPKTASYVRLCFAREQGVLQEGLTRLLRYFDGFYVPQPKL